MKGHIIGGSLKCVNYIIKQDIEGGGGDIDAQAKGAV